MSKLVISRSELNDLKIAKAILMNLNSSWLLVRNKLYTVADILGYIDDQVIDDWVEENCDLIMKGLLLKFNKVLLKELLSMEAYLEIRELNLHRIKL